MTKTKRFSAITSPLPKAMNSEAISPAASLYQTLSKEDGSPTDESRMRAAQYVRMSTERQDFSLETQAMANTAYAADRKSVV